MIRDTAQVITILTILSKFQLIMFIFWSIMSATCRHSDCFYYIRFPFCWSLLCFFFLQEYQWDNTIKGNLLASFFWGYIVTQIPAGQLAQKYGPKILLTIAMFLSSLFTILMPVAVEVGGWGLLCGTRVIQGLAQVSCWFCTIFHINNWCSKDKIFTQDINNQNVTGLFLTDL
jgi:MFS family permease